MIWDERDKKTRSWIKMGAVVDSYAGRLVEQHPALLRLKEHHFPKIAFVAATHPHLDHLRNLHVVLRHCHDRIQNVFWWGGDDDSQTSVHYRLLSEDARLNGKEPGQAAAMAAEFLEKARFLAGHGSERAKRVGLQALMAMSPLRQPLGRVTVWPISPWSGPKRGYTRSFQNQFVHKRTGTVVTPQSVRSNRISLGIVVEFGKAQILLGGDVESPNWNQWRQWRQRQTVISPAHLNSPSVIKVSHHGSPSGAHSEMWKEGAGFFGSHEDVDITQLHEEERPLCVITPWRRKNSSERLLPSAAVKKQIVDSGCRLLITGSPPRRYGHELDNNYCDSFVHIRVEESGRATVAEQNLCEICA